MTPPEESKEASTSDSSRRRRQLAITLVITVAVLGLVLWQVDPRPVVDALSGASLPLVAAAAVIAFFFNTVQSAEVLRHTLRGFSVRIGYRDALTATVGNLALHATLPAGAGNLTRVAYLQRVAGIDVARSTVGAVVALWFKLCSLVGLAAVGWLLLPDGEPVVGVLLASAVVGSVVITFGVPRSSAWLAGVAPNSGRVGRLTTALRDAMDDVRPAPLTLGFAHAFVAVGIELVVFGLLLAAVGVDPPWMHVIAFFPLTVIGAKIPATVMGIGTREALTVLLFAQVASPDAVLAATLLYSGAEHILPALIGTAVTWRFVRRAVEGREGASLGDHG